MRILTLWLCTRVLPRTVYCVSRARIYNTQEASVMLTSSMMDKHLDAHARHSSTRPPMVDMYAFDSVIIVQDLCYRIYHS